MATLQNYTPKSTPDLDSRKIAEATLGEIDWRDSYAGYCQCPGEHLHSHRTGKRDCQILLDGAPTLYCFHTSCGGLVEQFNYKLRSEIGKAERGGFIQDWKPSAADIARRMEKERIQQLKLKATHSLDQILRQFSVAHPDVWEASPVRLDESAEDDWKLHLQLFNPDDVVWIGKVYDSGSPENQSNFRQVSEWLKEPKCPGNFTSGGVFKPGSQSRSNAAVIERRYLVIESDSLKRHEMLSVVAWCQQFMQLRAIVDTAGKSLHGWFTFPLDDVLAELKVILPQLGCDPALFKPSQPCRLAGAYRREKKTFQSLLYLDLGKAAK